MAAAGRDVCGALLTWDLADGVALAYVLHSIDSSWFNETWLGLIRDDAGDNWRLKVSNLRKVLQSLLEYWQDVLGQAVAERHIPDVVGAAQSAEPQELRRMVRMVLGCTVRCGGRDEHIRRILTLEEPVQRVVMMEIQELLDQEAPEAMVEPEESEEQVAMEALGPGQRCRELEQEVVALQRERSRLAEENRALREENERLEAGREELRARCRRLEREARALQERAERMRGPAAEARALREERDELRAASARAGRLEAAVAAFRGRTGELRRRARALEEREAAQGRRAAALQRELSRAQAGCARLQAARRQVEELSGQQAEAALQAERWQREFRCLQERYRALSEEKERLQEERDELREANEELRCAQLQQSCLRQADRALVGSLAAEIIPAELRDTVMRLQRENRRLQERLEATGVTPLHSTQDSQAEFLLLDETIDDLDEDLELHMDSSGSQCLKGLQQRQWRHSGGGHKVLDPPLTPDLQTLRNQLQEKEALIRHLEGDRERSRAQREREERLLVTAWYNMGLALQQQQEEEEGGGRRRGAPPGGLTHSWPSSASPGAPPTAAPPPANGGFRGGPTIALRGGAHGPALSFGLVPF